MEVGEVLNSYIEILEFTAIQDIVREQIRINTDLMEINSDIIQKRIHIDKIVLGLTKVMQKDSNGKFILIPTWSFFGYEVNKYSRQQPGGYILDENNEYKYYAVGRSFLTINAIDGSVIDPALGY